MSMPTGEVTEKVMLHIYHIYVMLHTHIYIYIIYIHFEWVLAFLFYKKVNAILFSSLVLHIIIDLKNFLAASILYR